MNTPTNSLRIRPVNKACLVTGGTRGIGRAIAKMLLTEGAEVAICGRKPEAVDPPSRELATETGGKVKGKVADVKKHEQVGELFQFVDAHFGGLDVLVNNAGVGVFRPVSDLTLEEWRSTIDTNLSGAFYCSREALFRFVTRGGGYIVNINSLAGANAFAGGSAYNASKFGLTGFAEAMMQDVRSENVRVSTVMPGSVATGFGGQSRRPVRTSTEWLGLENLARRRCRSCPNAPEDAGANPGQPCGSSTDENENGSKR